MLPVSRNETCVAGVTEVRSATMNAMQDSIVNLHGMNNGIDFALFDDFTGEALDTGRWFAGNAATTFPADEECGIASLATNEVYPGAVISKLLCIGTRDFWFAARLRMPDYAIADDCGNIVGLYQLVGTPAYFKLERSVGATVKVKAIYGTGGGQVVTITNVDVPIENYAVFEIRKFGTKLEFLIDGNVVHTVNNFTATVNAHVFCAGLINNSDSGRIKLDSIGLIVWRRGVTGQVAGAGHEEGGVVAMAASGSGQGVDYYDVVFATPYPVGYVYRFNATASPAGASDDSIFVDVVSRTQNGMRLRPSAPFDGVISWEAR